MLCICAHMATVGVKGLNLYTFFNFDNEHGISLPRVTVQVYDVSGVFVSNEVKVSKKRTPF